MGFISDILEHEAIVSLLLAGTALGTVSRLECGEPLHSQSARESRAEMGSWKGSWLDLRKLPEFRIRGSHRQGFLGYIEQRLGPTRVPGYQFQLIPFPMCGLGELLGLSVLLPSWLTRCGKQFQCRNCWEAQGMLIAQDTHTAKSLGCHYPV